MFQFFSALNIHKFKSSELINVISLSKKLICDINIVGSKPMRLKLKLYTLPSQYTALLIKINLEWKRKYTLFLQCTVNQLSYPEPNILNCIESALLHPYLSLIRLAAYPPSNHITNRTFNFIHQCLKELKTMTEIRARHAERSQYNIRKKQIIVITLCLRWLPLSIDPPLPVKKKKYWL